MDPYEFPFLEEVYSPEQPQIDIVFVHGLNPRGSNDHPFKTWTHQNGTFWPRDLLRDDIPQARMFVYGYNSTVTDPQVMSTASVKDHANTLLNLLDMERSPTVNAKLPKIIFIGHSLGGLVIKQALLNAQEDPKYTSIRKDTAGLVFFGTPHRGTKGVELGKIAAGVAKFVSKGHASNELLDVLEKNSLFTRQMTSRFSHQLEDYRVVSFVEGKEVLLGGAGPASISHLVVDEESAVLNLPGSRETRLKLDADHSAMCKVANRGAMYKLIKGNIKQIADQVLLAENGYLPPRSQSSSAPPLPPRMHTNSSAPYPTASPAPSHERVIGALYTALDTDPRSIEAADHKSNWRWDQARALEYAIFTEHLRTLGAEHHSTLAVGLNLAEIEAEAGYTLKGAEWVNYVASNIPDKRDPLAMRAESLRSEILSAEGKPEEGESVCANLLARQQMTLGESNLDTLETRRRLAIAYSNLNRREEALSMIEKCRQGLETLLGPRHMKTIRVALYKCELMVEMLDGQQQNINRATRHALMQMNPAAQNTAAAIHQLVEEVTKSLGPRHPLSIYGLRLEGAVQTKLSAEEASETLRRALAIAEDVLGHEHPETMAIVAHIGVMYATQELSQLSQYRNNSSHSHSALDLAVPWVERYMSWAEPRKGAGCPDCKALLGMMAHLYFLQLNYVKSQGYYERLQKAHRAAGTNMASEALSQMQLCQMNTRFLTPSGGASGLSGFEGMLAAFQKRL